MSQPVRIGIAGLAGRMGREIATLAVADERVRLIGGIVHTTADAADWPGMIVVTEPGDLVMEIDVLLDFTLPEATPRIAAAAADAGVPLLCGVTGLGASGIAALQEAAEVVPVYWSRNLSLALPRVADLVRTLAGALSDFDVEITEAHHRGKLESPSGTALILAEAVAEGRHQLLEDYAVYGRNGVSPRQSGDIGIHALRAGLLPGEHTILFAGDDEELRITHRALNRRAFARGAIEAALAMPGRPPGLTRT